MNSVEFAEWLRDEMEKLQDKLDATRTDIARIDVTLAGQAADVAHHIRRTDALEARVEQVAADVRPVKEHVAMLRGAGKLVALVATILAITVALKQFIPK